MRQTKEEVKKGLITAEAAMGQVDMKSKTYAWAKRRVDAEKLRIRK